AISLCRLPPIPRRSPLGRLVLRPGHTLSFRSGSRSRSVVTRVSDFDDNAAAIPPACLELPMYRLGLPIERPLPTSPFALASDPTTEPAQRRTSVCGAWPNVFLNTRLK